MKYERPFLPTDRPGVHIERAMLASMRAVANGEQRGAVKIAAQAWPGDTITPAILKAASAPADTLTPGWAKELAPNLIGDFIGSLQPMSAAAKLINAALRLTLDGYATVSMPRRSTAKAATDVAWVGEGQPIPTRQYQLNTVTLGPTHKLPLIVVVTRELAEHAAGETVITQMIREDIAASLDASMFSTATGPNQPDGLLAGVTPLSAASASPDLAEAMYGDLSNIAEAIANNGGSGNVVYIAAAKQAQSAKLRLLTDATIWPSAALAAGTVIGIDPGAFVSAFGPDPKIDASKHTSIVMRTDPAPVATGSPAVMGAPLRSLWQTDCVAIRCILDAAWAQRQPGMVQWVQNSNW